MCSVLIRNVELASFRSLGGQIGIMAAIERRLWERSYTVAKCAVLKKICAVLMKELCSSKVCSSKAQGCRKLNISENDRFRYEMIGKTQLEIEVLEEVSFIYCFSLK